MKRTVVAIESIFREKDPEMWIDIILTGLLREAVGDPLSEKILTCPQVSKWHPEGNLQRHIWTVFKNAVMAEEKDLDVFWIILFHDIGKVDTFKFVYNEDGSVNRTTFYGHEYASVKHARRILKELEMEEERIEKIVWVISQHMRISQISKMKKKKVEEMVNHPYFDTLYRFHQYDNMITKKDPDCRFIDGYLKGRDEKIS